MRYELVVEGLERVQSCISYWIDVALKLTIAAKL